MLLDKNPLLRTDLPFAFDAFFVKVPYKSFVRLFYYIEFDHKLRHFWTNYRRDSTFDEDVAVHKLFGRANDYLDSLKTRVL